MLTTLRNALIGLFVLGIASSALAQDPELGDIEADDNSADAPGVAEAPGAAGAKPISVGLLLGYGISFEDGPNAWGLGFGVRGGYNIDAIYLGARFVYHIGEDPFSLWELGIEGGYDFAAGPVIIRPELGLGIANVSYSIDIPFIGEQSGSDTNPYVSFGASVLYDVTPDFFIGGNGRIQIVIGDGGDGTALVLMANGGMRF